MQKYLWSILLLLGVTVAGRAQQFKVSTFRLLPNDITAWINPVRDLNHEACALLKIVADTNFSFSGPLGVVKRENKVGEIWLYVPNGSIQITVKHPRWGILRDYLFPSPLESRLCYEMVIEPPSVEMQREGAMTIIRERRGLPTPRIDSNSIRPMPRGKLSSKRPAGFAIVTAGIYRSKPSVGLFAGVLKKHGLFVHCQSDWQFPSSDGECNGRGILAGTEQTPYYTGNTRQQKYTVLMGGIHRIAGLFHLYEGIGWGKYAVYWETMDGDHLKNTDLSTQGIAAEVGVLFKVQRVALSAGAITIRGKHWEPTVGVGINF